MNSINKDCFINEYIKKKSTGFSLIELMITLLLSSILILGVTSLVISNQQTMALVNTKSSLQAKGDAILNVLGSAVLNSGFYGPCSSLRMSNEAAKMTVYYKKSILNVNIDSSLSDNIEDGPPKYSPPGNCALVDSEFTNDSNCKERTRDLAVPIIGGSVNTGLDPLKSYIENIGLATSNSLALLGLPADAFSYLLVKYAGTEGYYLRDTLIVNPDFYSQNFYTGTQLAIAYTNNYNMLNNAYSVDPLQYGQCVLGNLSTFSQSDSFPTSKITPVPGIDRVSNVNSVLFFLKANSNRTSLNLYSVNFGVQSLYDEDMQNNLGETLIASDVMGLYITYKYKNQYLSASELISVNNEFNNKTTLFNDITGVRISILLTEKTGNLTASSSKKVYFAGKEIDLPAGLSGEVFTKTFAVRNIRYL